MHIKMPRFQLAHRGSGNMIVRVCFLLVGLQFVSIRRGWMILTFVSLAVSADLVRLDFEEALDGGLVLRRPLSSGVGRSSGHD